MKFLKIKSIDFGNNVYVKQIGFVSEQYLDITLQNKTMRNLKVDQLSEKFIINSLLKKLNLNKQGTFNFKNDAAYLNTAKNYKTIITTDSITENIDFFYNDPPESIAQKLVCVNLSDLSAMGSVPVAYTLNLSLNSKININWIKKFTNRLFTLQKKFNFFDALKHF